jgi:hypothetical protein
MAKSSALSRALAVLQIRDGEGRLVAGLFGYAFIGGIPLTLTSVSANVLFLEHHGAALLPWAYLGSAVAVPAAGWLCLRIEHRASFERFLLAIVGMLCLGDVAAWLGLRGLGPVRGTWALPVWAELEYALTSLQLWALVGRVLNVQQGKRLFGVVGAGAMLSAALAGLASPALVRLLGIEQQLLVSASASLLGLFALHRLCTTQRHRLDRDVRVHGPANSAKSKPAGAPGNASGSAVARAPRPAPELRAYERAMGALLAFGFVSYYVVERIFYDRVEARLPDADQLAAFLGVLVGVSGFFSLGLRAWLGAQLLARFGLSLGLMALPVVVTLGAAFTTMAGATLGAEALLVFWSVVVMRSAATVLRESLDLQSGLMLYQPLPPARRIKVQTLVESVVGPLAGGVAGATLLVGDHVGVSVVGLALGLAFIGLAWAGVANYLCRAYRRVLEHALADRRLSQEDLVLGESARAPLLRALSSRWAGEVLYALDMLEELGFVGGDKWSEARPATIFKQLLEHEAAEVRREALRRIERRALTELVPHVAVLAQRDADAGVQSRAFRVLGALADDDQAERLWLETRHAEPSQQRELMTGFLGSGSLDRIALAWSELRRLSESAQAVERIRAAQILRQVGAPAFHRPLLKLLGDPEREVQRAALAACKSMHHPLLLPQVVAALSSRTLRSVAATTLVAIGESALEGVSQLAREHRDFRVQVRALRIAARVKGRHAERLAIDLLQSPLEEVRHASLLTLVSCGHRQATHRAAFFEHETATSQAFERLLRAELAEATWTLGALRDLYLAQASSTNGPASLAPASLVPASMPASHAALSGPGTIDDEGHALVSRALRRELSAGRERILLLLSFLYDAQVMHAARSSYASPSSDRRAMALELLDSVLPAVVRSQVFPIFDEVRPSQALANMPEELVDEDAARRGRRGRLRDLLDPERSNVTTWTRVCALWALEDRETVGLFADSADDEVRETARYLLANPERDCRGGPMLTVEKVLILRAVHMFRLTPDYVLAELSGILKELDLEAGVTLIKEGDIGDCMFVIVHGAVKVQRGADVVASLGPRDIVGEMSMLDPEPRSASVVTTAPTRVLRIDRGDFYDLMADRIEIAQGVLSVLCERLRSVSRAV